MNISVIIPAYNEEKWIESTLRNIINFLNDNFGKYEIIVVDDGSKDRTAEIVSRYKCRDVRIIKNKKNMGKGYSVKRGILEARYGLVLFTDSDNATPIEELKKFIDYVYKGYDIVIASRNLKDSNVKAKQAFLRHLMGKAFPLLVRLIVLREFKDTQCGFKLFKKEAAKRIMDLQTFERYAFDVELLFIAKRMGYKIKEAPVTWTDKEGSKVNPLKDSFTMLMDLFRIRFNEISGKYRV